MLQRHLEKSEYPQVDTVPIVQLIAHCPLPTATQCCIAEHAVMSAALLHGNTHCELIHVHPLRAHDAEVLDMLHSGWHAEETLVFTQCVGQDWVFTYSSHCVIHCPLSHTHAASEEQAVSLP